MGSEVKFFVDGNTPAFPAPPGSVCIDVSHGIFYEKSSSGGPNDNAGWAPIPITALSSVVTKLSAAQLSNSLATPPIVLPAPAASFMAHPVFATLQYMPVSVDYTLGDVTQFFIGPTGSPTVNNVLQPLSATLFDGSGGPGSVIGIVPAENAVQGLRTIFANTALVITHNGSGEITGGDGTATVTIYYVVAAC